MFSQIRDRLKTIIYKTIVILFLLGTTLARADEGYFFKQISLDDGLTQSTVRCILTDHKGYIWIGTRLGLNRYDRYSLNGYLHNKNDPGSIPGNQIIFLSEDRKGNIWIGTEKGLALYDRKTDKFRTILYQGKPLVVRSAIRMPQGMIFGGEGMLYQFKSDGSTISRIPIVSSEVNMEMFTKMAVWEKDKVLLQTQRNGAWLFNAANKTLKRAKFIEDKDLMGLYIDKQHRVWISPYGKGVKAFDRSGKMIYHFTSENSGLNTDVVLDMLEKDNKIWMATDGGGINIFDLQAKTFSNLSHVPGNAASLPEKSILSLYNDHEDNLWAGSIRGGLISIRKTFISTYREAPVGGAHGLSQKTVLSTYEDKSGILWLGTDGGGVNRFDPKSKIFKHYLPTYGLKVASITDFSDQELLIYAFSKGVYLFNKSSGNVRPFKGKTGMQIGIQSSSGIAVNLNKVSPDYIYLFSDQIIRYDIRTGKFAPVDYKPTANAHSSLLKIYANNEITYLFGPYGLFELNHEQNKIKPLLALRANGTPITAAAVDSRGVFWIGNRNGLMYYRPGEKKLHRVPTGLFNEISALVIDKQDRLWIGAHNMVFLYKASDKKFVAFGESDGVVPNELLYKACIAAENGNTYLGGVNGLLEIKKNIPTNTSGSPVIELMALEVNGVPLNPQGRRTTIPWNHSSLGIKVMAREKDVFRKKMFRFQIAGLDSRIIETYDHSLPIGSLPVGNYRIMVASNLKNGGWSTYTEVLNITVSPPWFLGLWFITLILLAISAIIILFYRMAIAKRERKLQWDLKEHKLQTDEAKINFLIHISHELRTPLTLIYSPLRRLLKEKTLNGELARILEGIYRQAGNMRNIIDMVLDLQKIELAQEQLKLESYELNEWVLNIVENFSGEFDQKDITLKYELDHTIPEIAFDGKKCALVLTNLMANALKFSPTHTQITVSTALREGFVRISVKDEGIGLEHVDIRQLFKPFYQGTHSEHGSGIGLSYSKTLIEMHGGIICAENNLNKGATFFFELPADLQAATTTVVAPISPERMGSEFPTLGYTLMIVEDEPELLLFLTESLKPHFKEIIEAADGLQAASIIDQRQPDIILSDVMMPGMDGFELCRRLKEDLYVSHTPFVLLTTQGDAESRNLGYKLGADAYIAKPFDLDYLQTILANLLKNRELVKSKYKTSPLSIPAQEGTFSSADELFIIKLNELIRDNIESKDLHVNFLTDKMAMSRATLYNKLKQIADIGVNDYINKLRLERACYLLTHTDKNIMEIADSLGFNNQRYFSTVFKQFYKITPTAYRNEHHQAAEVQKRGL